MPSELAAAVAEQWHRLVAKTMARTGLSRADAEDVLQDVTERILRQGAPADVRDWFHYLAEAAKNRATDAHRRERSAERRAARAPRTAWLAHVPVDDVAEVVLARLELDAALDALDTLPEATARVFRLREYDGLRVREIAARLGLTAKQVEHRLKSARERLAALREEGHSTEAFAVLAVLLRRVRTGAPASMASAAAATAGIVILSVLAAVVMPLPIMTRVDTTSAPVPWGPSGSGWSDARRRPGSAPDAAPSLGGPPAAGSAGGFALRPGTAGPVAIAVVKCLARICVSAGSGGGASDRPVGDVLTIRRLSHPHVGQNVTRLCWLVPDNGEVSCESDEESRYRVRTLPQPPRSSGKSSALVPIPGKPTKGSTR